MLHLPSSPWGTMLMPSVSWHRCQSSLLTSGATPRRTKGFVGAMSSLLLSRKVPESQKTTDVDLMMTRAHTNSLQTYKECQSCEETHLEG